MARSDRHRGDRRVREEPATGYSTDEERLKDASRLSGILLDSDIVIGILRGNPEVIETIAEIESAGISTYCTAITWAEIHAGLRPGEEAPTEAFFEARGEVVLDAVAGRRAGQYLSRYRDSEGVELADALIAAAAVTSGLRLWTRNRRHYPMAELELFEP